MITNEVQYRATLAHLRQFEEAATNLQANAGAGKRSKLAQVELDAVRAQAEDLRNEVDEYEQLAPGRCRPSRLRPSPNWRRCS